MVQFLLTATSASLVQAIVPAPASQVAAITGTRYHAHLIFVYFIETRFHLIGQVGQVGLKLLTSSGTPTSASQSAGITGVSYCAQLIFCIFSRDGVSLC